MVKIEKKTEKHKNQRKQDGKPKINKKTGKNCKISRKPDTKKY